MHTKTKSLGYFYVFVAMTIFSVAALLALSSLLPANLAEAAGVNEQTIFRDGFESGNTKNWTSNVGWNVVDNDAAEMQSRARSLGDNSSDTDILTRKISTTGYENVRIAFDFKTTDLESDDTVKLQVYSEGRWRTLKTFTNGRESLHWAHTSVSVPFSNRADFAFRFVSDLSDGDEMSIDWVQLIGTPTNDQKPSNIQSITAHIYRTSSSVEIDYDDTSRWLRFNLTNEDNIIEETGIILGLTEAQVFSFITFEYEDR